MITTYVRHIPADFSSKCANCSQEVTPGMLIYWHGRKFSGYKAANELGNVTHEGCFWDSKNGPAPHLSWRQLVALKDAVNSHRLPDDIKVQRLMGAVRLALSRRQDEMYRQDQDAGLRMGPDLLEGYRMTLKAIRLQADPFWHPVEMNGQPWTNPEKAPPTEERTTFTPQEWQERRESWVRLKPGADLDRLTPAQIALQEQFASDGFMVKGFTVMPVKVGSTNGPGQLWVRPADDPDGWKLVSARQVFMTESEANEDARNWRPRAVGGH